MRTGRELFLFEIVIREYDMIATDNSVSNVWGTTS